jgi:hypothetical protein
LRYGNRDIYVWFLTAKGDEEKMSSRQKGWQSMDKASISIAALANWYLAGRCSGGMSRNTISGQNETLEGYACYVGGTFRDFLFKPARKHQLPATIGFIAMSNICNITVL